MVLISHILYLLFLNLLVILESLFKFLLNDVKMFLRFLGGYFKGFLAGVLAQLASLFIFILFPELLHHQFLFLQLFLDPHFKRLITHSALLTQLLTPILDRLLLFLFPHSPNI